MERTFAMSKLSAEYYLLLLEVCKSIYGEDFVNRCPHQLERGVLSYLDIQRITEVTPFGTGLHLATTFDPDTCYKT